LRRSAAEHRVLGIDPGTSVTGYGIVERRDGERSRLVECGVIRTSPRHKIWHRLDVLYEGVCELIARHQPSGHARGVILLAAAQAGIEIAEFSPASVKKSVTGVGGATKPQVGYMVKQILRLHRAPAPSDAADGVAVALAYLLSRPGRQ
jgi:crossover junction endodeoxyribonuclease RuvC